MDYTPVKIQICVARIEARAILHHRSFYLLSPVTLDGYIHRNPSDDAVFPLHLKIAQQPENFLAIKFTNPQSANTSITVSFKSALKLQRLSWNGRSGKSSNFLPCSRVEITSTKSKYS